MVQRKIISTGLRAAPRPSCSVRPSVIHGDQCCCFSGCFTVAVRVRVSSRTHTDEWNDYRPHGVACPVHASRVSPACRVARSSVGRPAAGRRRENEHRTNESKRRLPRGCACRRGPPSWLTGDRAAARRRRHRPSPTMRTPLGCWSRCRTTSSVCPWRRRRNIRRSKRYVSAVAVAEAARPGGFFLCFSVCLNALPRAVSAGV